MNRIDRTLDAYDRGVIGRRELLEALAGVFVAGVVGVPASATPQSVVRARTLNHVSIIVSELGRSKAFYQRLAGLPVRAEGEDYCEFRLSDSFLGLYAQASEPTRKIGIDHFCLGIDGFEPAAVFNSLKRDIPEAAPSLEYEGQQVYVRDPDDVRVQFSDLKYKG